MGTEAFELLKVGDGEVLQAAGAETGEVQTNDSVVFLVDVSLDKAGPLGAVDELHGAVVTCQKDGRQHRSWRVRRAGDLG